MLTGDSIADVPQLTVEALEHQDEWAEQGVNLQGFLLGAGLLHAPARCLRALRCSCELVCSQEILSATQPAMTGCAWDTGSAHITPAAPNLAEAGCAVLQQG